MRTRPKRRGKKADDSSSAYDEDDSVLKARSNNMSRMGDMIKNSPVAQGIMRLSTRKKATAYQKSDYF